MKKNEARKKYKTGFFFLAGTLIFLVLWVATHILSDLTQANRLGDQGKLYATQALRDIAKKWDFEEINDRESEEMSKSVSRRELEATWQRLDQKLGSLTRVVSVRTRYTHLFNKPGGKMRCLVTVQCECKFEKGKAFVFLFLLYEHDEWRVNGIRVDSPALSGTRYDTNERSGRTAQRTVSAGLE